MRHKSRLCRTLAGRGGIVLLLLLVPAIVQSQGGGLDDDSERLVELQTASVILKSGEYDAADHRHVVLQLSRDLKRAEIDSLSAAGVRLVSYLGDGAFIAGVDPGALTPEICAEYGVEAATPWRSENKATPGLLQGAAPAWARSEDGLLKTLVLFFEDVARSEMEAVLRRHATSYTMENPPLLWAAEIEPSRLGALLQEQAIYMVEPGPMPRQPLTDQARALIHVDQVQQADIGANPPSIKYDGLTGKGIMLEVSESVWDGHPDFMDAKGKTRFDNPSPDSGWPHGTSVAGIMGGNGLHSASLQNTPFYGEIGRWRGMAPEASLYEGDYGGSKRLIDASNDSWHMDTGVYGISSAGIDKQIHASSKFGRRWPQVWSAGNQALLPQNGPDVGYYSIYAPAKNSIAVGSVNASDGSLSAHVSSLGPTFDGRIKPDVVAPGSKNHLPPAFDLFADRMEVTVDYIRIYNTRTGAVDAAWEFDQDGDAEGWFQTGTWRIYDVNVAGGYLTYNMGFWPEAGNVYPYGWNNQVDVDGDPDHEVMIKYKISTPAGPTAAEAELWWHWGNRTGATGVDGVIRFPVVADDSWVVQSIPVGEWGQASEYLGGWRGKIDALGMVPFSFAWPGIISPARYSREISGPEGAVSAGEYHTCGLTPDGQADCWGASVAANDHGQAADQAGPFFQVGAGALHSCGLKLDGSVQCWGKNNYGQAEDQTGSFTQISVGGDYNCGLRGDGSVDCWGRNDLGYADDQAGPFTQISAGWQHTCGLTPAGAIDCWGSNSYGESEDKAGPFVQVSTGWGHTCGLRPDGKAKCWGRNDDGQAGNRAGPFSQISAGGRHTCGLKLDDTVDCWGFNSDGQAANQSDSFAQISAGGTWMAGSTGWGHTCGLKLDGSIVCWGSNGDGQAQNQPGDYGGPVRIYAYRSSQGTSESAPVVTGSVALILQQFRDRFSLNLKTNPPLPSTIKAVLVQTAQDLVHKSADPRDPDNPDTGSPVLYHRGPDYATGYGLVDIKAAVDLVGADPGPGAASRFLHEGEVDAYDKDVYAMWLTKADIAKQGGELKFTLAWDDRPGSTATPETQPKLVNDLDLYLVDPDGTTHLPWTLDPLPIANCRGAGTLCGDPDPITSAHVVAAKRGRDERNNVEMVQVEQPKPGRWQVIVDAHKVPLPTQQYSLVGNQLTSPPRHTIMVPLILRDG